MERSIEKQAQEMTQAAREVRRAVGRAEGSRACKHGLACWALWRAASGAQFPQAAVGEIEREQGEASGQARAA